MESNRTTIFVYGRINATDSASSIHSPDLDLDIRVEAGDPKMQLATLMETLDAAGRTLPADGRARPVDIVYTVSGGEAPVSRFEFLRVMEAG